MALAVFFRALNNVRVTIDPSGSGITNSATSIVLDTGDGASVPNALTPILMTIFDSISEDIFEIIQVDSVAGDTLTVQRGQQGTSGIAWGAGTQIEQRNPAAEVNQFADALTDGNSELEFANLTLGVDGLDVDPGSDINADLITVGVTDSPTLSWDEGADRFDLSKGLQVDGLLSAGTGPVTLTNAAGKILAPAFEVTSSGTLVQLTLTTGLLTPQVGPSGDADLLTLAANLATVKGALKVDGQSSLNDAVAITDVKCGGPGSRPKTQVSSRRFLISISIL